MDGYLFCFTLCLLLAKTVFGEMLVSKREGVIVTSSSQHVTIDSWDIYYAVDGNADTNADTCRCCGATSAESNPWFKVDLGQEYTIQRIHVLGRTDYVHYLYKMEIQLGTTESDGTVIQGVNASKTDIRELDHTLIRPQLARYITLTLRGVTEYFVICELYVYAECIDGRYGPNCNEDCGKCNNNDVCETRNGNCPNGCSAGYGGTNCKEVCSLGTYGMNCANTCGRCENNEACNIVDGTCTSCLTGYLFPVCKHCIEGRYGPTCDEHCGQCINNNSCDKNNGICLNGCSAGYQGNTCKEECEDGIYGPKCPFKCGNCFNNGPCNKIDGGCTSCAAGFKGTTCVDECLTGTFGFNCKQRCGMCLDGDVCDIYTGECPNGCVDGYKGGQCLQEINQDVTPCSDTGISLPVFIGSLFAVIVVYTTIVLACFLYRRKQHKKSHKAATSGDNLTQLPNTASNYDTLQFDNPVEESRFSELNRRSLS